MQQPLQLDQRMKHFVDGRIETGFHLPTDLYLFRSFCYLCSMVDGLLLGHLLYKYLKLATKLVAEVKTYVLLLTGLPGNENSPRSVMYIIEEVGC